MSNSIDAVRHRIKRLKELGEDFVMKLGEIDCAFMLEQYDQLKQENEVLKKGHEVLNQALAESEKKVDEFFKAYIKLKKKFDEQYAKELNKEGAE